MLELSIKSENNHILLVDDTPNNLRLLAKILESVGYSVRKTVSGMMAIQAAQVEPPMLILLDITMPEMSGYEVCGHLKSNPKTQDIPIVFISALDQSYDKAKAFDVGGVDYITKPFQEQEVLARVKTQMLLRQYQILVSQQQKTIQSLESELAQLKMLSHEPS
jgi:PleD family two-component response regulator